VVIETSASRQMRGKLENRGCIWISLGRSLNHSVEIGRFLNLTANYVILSRDITWLGKTYGEWKGIQGFILSFADTSTESDSDNEPEPNAPVAPPLATIVDAGNNNDISPSSVVVEDNDIGNGNDINNDCAYMMMDRRYLNEIALSNGLMEGTKNVSPESYKDIYDAPMIFHEAYFHDDKWERSKWQVVIKNELTKMEQYKVMEVVPRTKIPSNGRCVKHTWIFDIKRNGIFRARLVACGYSEVPGLDFTEAYSQVINDVVFRILILL
jgi:hypothetical protein